MMKINMVIVTATTLFVVHFADMLVTIYGVLIGVAAEVNPILVHLMGYYGFGWTMIIVQLFLSIVFVIVIILLYLYQEYYDDTKWEVVFMTILGVATIIRVMVLANDILVIL